MRTNERKETKKRKQMLILRRSVISQTRRPGQGSLIFGSMGESREGEKTGAERKSRHVPTFRKIAQNYSPYKIRERERALSSRPGLWWYDMGLLSLQSR